MRTYLRHAIADRPLSLSVSVLSPSLFFSSRTAHNERRGEIRRSITTAYNEVLTIRSYQAANATVGRNKNERFQRDILLGRALLH